MTPEEIVKRQRKFGIWPSEETADFIERQEKIIKELAKEVAELRSRPDALRADKAELELADLYDTLLQARGKLCELVGGGDDSCAKIIARIDAVLRHAR